MYLISATDQAVHIGDREFRFRSGEKILTEHSYKHTPEGFIALARQAEFDFVKLWTDRRAAVWRILFCNRYVRQTILSAHLRICGPRTCRQDCLHHGPNERPR